MEQRFRDDPDNESDTSNDDGREIVIKKAWDQLTGNNIFLVLGSRMTTTPSLYSTSRPDPDLQSIGGRLSDYVRFVEGRSLDEVSIWLPASFTELRLFTNERSRLLDRIIPVYFGPSTDPVSLSSMLGIAVRIARRLGIHSESISAKCTPFEAEMRRRLWWALVLFDARIGELADSKSVSLDPTWDCNVPLNVNDSDLRPEMKQAPAAGEHLTDAIFAVVRGEVGEFIRHSNFHLDFTNPALKPVAQDVQHDSTPEVSEIVTMERIIEDRYLKLCDPEIPVHFMTIWMTRGHLARCRLVEQISNFGNASSPSAYQVDTQVDNGLSYAFRMLECDTKIMAWSLTKGYLWLAHFHFQFLAYVYIVDELRRHPMSKYAGEAWELMSDNFEARSNATGIPAEHSPLFKVFTMTVLPAWEAREAAIRGLGEPLTPPRMVTSIRRKLGQLAQNSLIGKATKATEQQPDNVMGLDGIDFSMSMPTDFHTNSPLFGMGIGAQEGYAGAESRIYPGLFRQALLDVDVNQVNWAAMDWGLGE
ncbi:C6 transcription factor [Whalleya microplaca]|nr:C6 transcription factor [Whalleya microplaca]